MKSMTSPVTNQNYNLKRKSKILISNDLAVFDQTKFKNAKETKSYIGCKINPKRAGYLKKFSESIYKKY
jgi:hypothetical protein